MTSTTSYSPPPAFGRFKLLHQIGAGVLGPVFRTHDPDHQRLVAIKAFSLDLTPEQASALSAQLQRLVDLGIEHPCIAAPIATGVEDFVAYLAVPYVAGESLDAAIRQYGPAPAGDAIRLIAHVAEALDGVAQVGVFHGSLHPRDVLVTPGETHVTGFGIAQALERVGLHGPIRRPYVAPEREMGDEWGAAADIYSLAAIAYEVLTGRRALPGTEQPLPGLNDLRVHDAAALKDLIEAALDPDPERRPSRAQDFAADFAAALSVGAGAHQAGGGGQGTRPRKPRTRPQKLPGLDEPLRPVGHARVTLVRGAAGARAAAPTPTGVGSPKPGTADGAAVPPFVVPTREAAPIKKIAAGIASQDDAHPAPAERRPEAPATPEPDTTIQVMSPGEADVAPATAPEAPAALEPDTIQVMPPGEADAAPAAAPEAPAALEPDTIQVVPPGEADAAPAAVPEAPAALEPDTAIQAVPAGHAASAPAEALGIAAAAGLDTVTATAPDAASSAAGSVRDAAAASVDVSIAIDEALAASEVLPRPLGVRIDIPKRESPASAIPRDVVGPDPWFDLETETQLAFNMPDEFGRTAGPADAAQTGRPGGRDVETARKLPGSDAVPGTPSPTPKTGIDLAALDLSFPPDAPGREMTASKPAPRVQERTPRESGSQPGKWRGGTGRLTPVPRVPEPVTPPGRSAVPKALETGKVAPAPRALPDLSLLARPEPSRLPGFSLVVGVAVGLTIGLAVGYWLGTRSGAASPPRGGTQPVATRPAVEPAGPPSDGQTGQPQVAGGAEAPAAPQIRQAADGSGPPAAIVSDAATPQPSAAGTQPSAAGEGEARPAPSSNVGSIAVTSKPPTANVYLDGVRDGLTPRNLRDLPLGSHTIRVTCPGYAPQERRVELTAEKPSAVVEFTLSATNAPEANTPAADRGPISVLTLTIETRPPGAQIRIDGRDLGVTPLTVRQLRPGRHKVELRLQDHRPWSSDITVAAGDQRRITATLERDTIR